MVFFELVDFGFAMVWRSVWLAGWLAGNRVALYSILCVGAVVLYSSGAAYFFNDMGTGAPSRTVWRRILFCVTVRLSCIVAAPPSFVMIWALARHLAQCGDVFCFVCRRGCLV